MSKQDYENCSKCGEPCGYDDNRAYLDYSVVVCGQCRDNMAARFVAFFGLDGYSAQRYSMELDWKEIDLILSKINQDENRHAYIIVTAKEIYQRTVQIDTPVGESS